MKKIETHFKTILIETDMGDYEVTFNPSVPTGYDVISKAIQKHIADNEFSKAMATRDKQAASVYWIMKQSEDAEAYINAIKTVLDEDQFKKIENVIRHIDISSLAMICNSIADSYAKWYKEKLTEGFEV